MQLEFGLGQPLVGDLAEHLGPVVLEVVVDHLLADLGEGQRLGLDPPYDGEHRQHRTEGVGRGVLARAQQRREASRRGVEGAELKQRQEPQVRHLPIEGDRQLTEVDVPGVESVPSPFQSRHHRRAVGPRRYLQSLDLQTQGGREPQRVLRPIPLQSLGIRAEPFDHEPACVVLEKLPPSRRFGLFPRDLESFAGLLPSQHVLKNDLPGPEIVDDPYRQLLPGQLAELAEEGPDLLPQLADGDLDVADAKDRVSIGSVAQKVGNLLPRSAPRSFGLG